MVIVATVTKKNVSLVQSSLWNITLTLTITDGATVIIKDFSEKYRTGQLVSSITSKFITVMQIEINKYKSEQIIFTHPQLDSAVSNIQAGLTV